MANDQWLNKVKVDKKMVNLQSGKEMTQMQIIEAKLHSPSVSWVPHQ